MAYTAIQQLGNSLNAELDAQFLGLGQYQSALNVDMDAGTLKKRGGLASYFTGIAGIPMLAQDFVDVNNLRHIMLATTTKVYEFNETTLVLTDRTPTGYSSTLSTPAQGTSFQFKWFLVNGSGFWSWDGITATLSTLPAGSPTTAKAILPYGNHLLLGNVVTSGGVSDVFKIQWSDFLLGTVWTAGDASSADIVDGNDAVMGFGLTGRLGAAFKEDSIYSITPIPSPLFYQFDRRVDYSGCIATPTIQNIPGLGLIHLWRDDLYIYNGIVDRPISDFTQQNATLRKDIYAALNASVAQVSWSVRDMAGQRYILFIPTSAWTVTTPTYNTYVFNWKYRTLTKYGYVIPGGLSAGGEHTFKTSRTFAQSTYAFSASPYRFNDQSGSQATSSALFGGSTSGKVYRIPSTAQYTDDGFAYTSSATTGLTDFSSGQKYSGFPMRKRIKRADVLFTQSSQTGILNVGLLKSDDGGLTTTTILSGPLWGSGIWGSFVWGSTNPAWIDQTAVFFGLQFSDSANTLAWEVKQAVLEVEQEADR
jgi:hypothetical protein